MDCDYVFPHESFAMEKEVPISEKEFGLRARTHGQKGTQICDSLANKCPCLKNSGNLFVKGPFYLTVRDILFDKEGHLFDRKGHLFSEGSQFCYKLEIVRGTKF